MMHLGLEMSYLLRYQESQQLHEGSRVNSHHTLEIPSFRGKAKHPEYWFQEFDHGRQKEKQKGRSSAIPSYWPPTTWHLEEQFGDSEYESLRFLASLGCERE